MTVKVTKGVIIICVCYCFLTMLCKQNVLAEGHKADCFEQDYLNIVSRYYSVSQDKELWNSLSFQEKINMCQISDEALESMSTDEMLECLLTYPLLVDITCFDNVLGVKQYLSRNSNVYNRVIKQADFCEEIEYWYDVSFSWSDDFVVKKAALFYLMFEDEISTADSIMSQLTNASEGFNGNYGTYHTKTLSHGVNVNYISGTYSKYGTSETAYKYYNGDYNTIQKNTIDLETEAGHSDWIRLCSATGKFNCHSFSLISTDVYSNQYWLGGYSNMVSSSYFTYCGIVSSYNVGDIVVINTSHSVIVTYGGVSAYPSSVKVKSKLSSNGAYITSLYDMSILYGGGNKYVYRH